MPTNDFLAGPGVARLVSVIIPTYNRGHFISETIASALAQSYPDIEIIVIDDGSTDDTRSVVTTIADRRVRYFYQENGGLSSARNAGLDEARGEFIAFLDSDDIWLPWKLAAQIAIFDRHPDVGMTWSDYSSFREAGALLKQRALRKDYAVYSTVDIETLCVRAGTLGDLMPDAPPEWRADSYHVGSIIPEMFLGNFVHPPTGVVRRARARQAGPYEPEVTGNGGEDYHYYYRISEHGPVALLDAPTILYRIHSEQISSTLSLQYARADVTLLAHWIKRRPPALPPSVIRRRLAAAHGWLGYEELQAGNAGAARSHLWRSVRLGAASATTVKWLLVSLLPRSVEAGLRRVKRALRRGHSP